MSLSASRYPYTPLGPASAFTLHNTAEVADGLLHAITGRHTESFRAWHAASGESRDVLRQWLARNRSSGHPIEVIFELAMLQIADMFVGQGPGDLPGLADFRPANLAAKAAVRQFLQTWGLTADRTIVFERRSLAPGPGTEDPDDDDGPTIDNSQMRGFDAVELHGDRVICKKRGRHFPSPPKFGSTMHAPRGACSTSSCTTKSAAPSTARSAPNRPTTTASTSKPST